MRKVFVLLAALAMGLAFSVMGTPQVAPTPEARAQVTTGPVKNKLACENKSMAPNGHASKTYSDDDGVTERREWDFSTRVYYTVCDHSYAIVTSLKHRIEITNNGCEHGNINRYIMNANKIGDWDSGNHWWECVGSQTLYTSSATSPGTYRIRPGDPANERCLATHLKVDRGPVLADYNWDTNSKCINFD